MGRYLVCLTGASGAAYGLRTMAAMIAAGQEVHGVLSPWGMRVLLQETGRSWEDWRRELRIPEDRVYDAADLAAPPASGSFHLDGTVVVPCSMSTLGAVASGAGTNLIHRAAAAALKEGRPLVLVPRETPLSLVDLRNLTSLAEAGAAILPASPAFYHKPATVDDLVAFMAGKILDRLRIPHDLYRPWGGMN